MLVREVRPDCPAPVHGTRYTYRKGCRCTDTMEQRRLYERTWRASLCRPDARRGRGPVTQAVPADLLVVAELVRGNPMPGARRVDRQAAIDQLDARKPQPTARWIAERVGTTPRSVVRQRARRRAREGA